MWACRSPQLPARIPSPTPRLIGAPNLSEGTSTVPAMTKDRSSFSDLVVTDCAPDDEPKRWQSGRARLREVSPGSGEEPRTRDTPGWVYVLCFDKPRSLRDTDLRALADRPRYSVPVSHYVGWTGRPRPMLRVSEHGRGSSGALVALLPTFTERDEEQIKALASCPGCGSSLNYYREAWELDRRTGASSS